MEYCLQPSRAPFTDIVGSTELAAEMGDPRQKVSLTVGIGWSKGYICASSFFYEQFYSPVALTEDQANGTLVGATAEQLRG